LMTTATEQVFIDKMQAEGWELFHYGMPDFVCRKDEDIIFVEVKTSVTERLLPTQIKTLEIFQKIKPCFVWSPKTATLIPVSEYLNTLKPVNDHYKRTRQVTPKLIKLMVKNGHSIKEIATYFGTSKETIYRRLKPSQQ